MSTELMAASSKLVVSPTRPRKSPSSRSKKLTSPKKAASSPRSFAFLEQAAQLRTIESLGYDEPEEEEPEEEEPEEEEVIFVYPEDRAQAFHRKQIMGHAVVSVLTLGRILIHTRGS